MRAIVAMLASFVVVTWAIAPGFAAEESDESIVTIVVAEEEFSEQPHISREVSVPLEQALVITLGSNPGSTGFQWDEEAELSDPEVLDQVDHWFEEPEIAPDEVVVGAPGNEIWVFEAVQSGETVVSMEYRRPWEEDEEPARTFTLTVVVE